MDASDRARYKQLALDTIIASPVHSKEAELAEALEKCVEEIEYHGDRAGPQPEPEGAILNLDTVQAIHGQLKERLADMEKVSVTADEVADLLRESLKDLRHDIKELGDEL